MTADGKPPRRMQSQAERDSTGIAARKERDRLADAGMPVEVSDEVTGKHAGEELQRLRSLRPTDLRFAHIEGRVDSAFSELGEIRGELGEVHKEIADARVEVAEGLGSIGTKMGELAGEMKGLSRLVDDQSKRQQNAHELDNAARKAQLDVDAATKKAQLEVDSATKKAQLEVDSATKKGQLEVDAADKKGQLEVDKAGKLDGIDARKESRTRVTKIIVGVVAVASSSAFLGWLFGSN